ncbi:MAG: phosphoglycerate dehydrogenase [Elusimicrobia bacterium]|nr:phosphoglycerate dehydrogenase [Elusimicrobiota bacterium]MDE2426931.1 phosphoglycerate dehydrogenase [Elusimicrobiota bacterium]
MSEKAVLVTTSSFGAADPAPRQALLGAGLSVHENPHKRKLTEAEVGELIERVRPVALLAGLEPLTAKVLEAAQPGLRVVSRCGIGLENVDLDCARRLGVAVCNTPDAPSQAVAELAIGLMLSVSRHIAKTDAALRRGVWKAEQGRLLGDKTVGVAGHGRIGARVAQLARGFGCRVLACDERGVAAPGVEVADLPRLLRESDILSLHLPLLPSTRNIIDERALSSMKPGALLINTSRGGLIDEAALERALREGRLAGGGLDVFEKEPYSGGLLDLPNVVLTPHMGSAARECRGRMEREAAENLLAALREAGVL